MVNDLNFEEFIEDEGKIKRHIKKFFLSPEFWNAKDNQFPINLKWKRKQFKTKNNGKISTKKGIYAFVLIPKFDNFIETKYLFYAGKTNRNFNIRFKEYIAEKEGKGKSRIKIWKMLNQYTEYLYFYYAEIDNESDVNSSEECLLNTFVPHINTQIPQAIIKPELKNLYE